jgi:hypothetical protein
MATDRYVDPGGTTIQAALNACIPGTPSNHDRIILRDGVYNITSGGGPGIDFRAGATGHAEFGALEIFSENEKGAILNFDALNGNALHTGAGANVKISNQVWTCGGGNTGQGDNGFLNATGMGVGWTFEDIDVDAMTSKPFYFASATIGLSTTFRRITSLANFAAQNIIYIVGSTTNLDLYLGAIDGRLHTEGSMDSAVRFGDVRDARIREMWTYRTNMYGLWIQAASANGTQDIDGSRIYIDTTIGSTAALHVGHTDFQYPGVRVHLSDVHTNDTAVYGIEFENGANNCSLIRFSIRRANQFGLALAENTTNIEVCEGEIDTVIGATAAGIAMVKNSRHRVQRNIIGNVSSAIRYDEAGNVPPNVENQRNTIKDNIFYGIEYAYRVESNAFDADPLSAMIGPNLVFSPSAAFALVGGVPKTQAEFETNAAIAPSIDESDTVSTGDYPPSTPASLMASSGVAGFYAPYSEG